MTFNCPRCGTEVSQDLYGPCGACREQLRETMRVTPNPLLCIKGVMAADWSLFVECTSCGVTSRPRKDQALVLEDVRVHMDEKHDGLVVTDEQLASIKFVD